MNIKPSVLSPITFLLLASGMASAKDDQGVNDYAKAYWNPQKSCVPFVRKYESVCGGNFADDPVDSKDTRIRFYDSRTAVNKCESLPLEQRPAVQSGQIISVYLKQAYINDFTERREMFFGKKRGEIAVVARVAELDHGNDFDFTDAGKDRGRLVYYSEGVQPGQFLNFSQLPVYGPIEYKGKPLMMEFYILELDVKENTEVSGLLSAAAGLGAVAYPPASSTLKILDTIGSGLLKANSSDIEFKYHAALLAGDQQIKSLKAGTLEYGNYAFVRMPYSDLKATAESNMHPWSRWNFNQKTGRLYDDEDCSSPLLDRTYFLVQINRASEATTLDPANTFANFMTRLTAQANASAQEKQKVIDALKQAVTDDKSYKDAKKLIAHANQLRWPKGDTSVKGALDSATVAELRQLTEALDNSLKIARNRGGKAPPLYDESRAIALVEAIGRLIGDTKTSPQAFDPVAVMDALQAP